MYVWNSTFPPLLLIVLSPAPFLTIKKLAFGSVVNCHHTLFASMSDKKFEIFKKLGQKRKQNKTKRIKQSFFENRRMLFFSECIQNIISDLKAICFVIFARKVFVSLNSDITSSRSLTPSVTKRVTDLEVMSEIQARKVYALGFSLEIWNCFRRRFVNY